MSMSDSFFLKSMTAYGKGHSVSSAGTFSVEIQTLNRKHLEIAISLPKAFNRLENEVRKLIEKKISRGQVKVTIFFHPEGNQAIPVFPNLPLALALKEAGAQIAALWGVSFKDILPFIGLEKDLLMIEEESGDDSSTKNALFQAIEEALIAVETMRLKEGETIALDFAARLNEMESALQIIADNSAKAAQKYRQKLEQKLEEFRVALADTQERLLREVALMAEKIDTTEEIVRFKSHLVQTRALLQKPFSQEKETKGKWAEFLIQEMMREINTVGAKNVELVTSKAVFFIKFELEKLREQVQNIE